MLKYLTEIRHILLRLADFVVIRTLQCWNLRRIICSSCLNLITRGCIRVSKLTTTRGKVKYFLSSENFYLRKFLFFCDIIFPRFCFMQKKIVVLAQPYFTIATYRLEIIRHMSRCSSTLKMCAVDECADIEEMPTIQRHRIYIFFARVNYFIMIILPICFSDERDKCKMKPGKNIFGCPP